MGLYAANHSTDATETINGGCYGKPIHIGKNVWLGGDVKVVPGVTVGDNAKLIERPDNIFKSSLPYGVLPLIFSYAIIYIKWFVMGERAMNPIYVPLGIILGLLLMLVHEALHGICYEKGQKVYIGICIPMGIIGMLSPMPDYMDVHIICKQVPKGASVHTQNNGFYWYK